MMIKNKKALVWSNIITIILSIITLTMIILWVSSFIQDSTYNTSIIECNTLINNVNGELSFFDNFSTPNLKLFNSIATFCPSKNVKISKNNLEPATDLVNDCWKKMGSGKDFLGANTEGKNVCVFCGFIKSNQDVTDFNSKFVEEIKKGKNLNLFDNTSSSNLNLDILTREENLPPSLTSGKNIMVYYFIHRLNFTPDNSKILGSETLGGLYGDLDNYYYQLKTSASKFMSQGSTPISALSYLASDPTNQAISGVILQDWRGNNEDFILEEELENKEILNNMKLEKSQVSNLNVACNTLIIPNINYN